MKTREQIFDEIMEIHNEQVKQGYEWSYGRWRHPNEPFYIEIDSIPTMGSLLDKRAGAVSKTEHAVTIRA